MASSQKLLNIEPQELAFRLELMKQLSCTIRLSNNSTRHVAFKVMTTSPENYSVKPNAGILPPGSARDIEVSMHALEEIPPNMECNDKFLIKSVVASPDDTVERSRKLFNERGQAIEQCKLKVLYVLPSHQQSSILDGSGQGSSLNRSILQERSLIGSQVQGTNGRLVDNLFVKGIIILFLSLIFSYLVIMKILPMIWSWSIVVSILVIKMGKRLVSDSIEDWIVKTLLCACLHFFSSIFRRNDSRSEHEPRVG